MLKRIRHLTRRAVLVTLVVTAMVVEPYTADHVHGQAVPQQICGAEGSAAPIPIGQPGAEGWANDQETLDGPFEAKRFQFSVKERGTAYVYVGDQWYNLNLGLFSMKTGAEIGCWSVEARGTSVQAERRLLQFIRPDERALEVEAGDYILTVRPGDAVGFSASKPFTVRIAVGPRACALQPANVPDPDYPGMTNKPENPDLFQVGMSYQPDQSEIGPFSLMSFSAYVSPPYTELFDFTWEIDGQPLAGVTDPTAQKPYADLPQTPDGVHTVKLTVTGAREYQDPTESRYNFTPFNGESRTVTCQFRGEL